MHPLHEKSALSLKNTKRCGSCPFQNCPQVKLCNYLKLDGFHKTMLLYCDPSKLLKFYLWQVESYTERIPLYSEHTVINLSL